MVQIYVISLKENATGLEFWWYGSGNQFVSTHINLTFLNNREYLKYLLIDPKW